jgi:5-(carboxyamino)imidazole ribonucleotide mutase
MEDAKPLVGVVMGSDSDWSVMRAAVEICRAFDVPCEVRVVSAHRTPSDMAEYGRTAHERGLAVIVAGAGGAAHLPGMLAAYSPLPVIGVPVPLAKLDGLDSLLSIVQMPRGVPVATVAIGGAANAGLLAVEILAARDEGLRARVLEYKAARAADARAADQRVQELARELDRPE